MNITTTVPKEVSEFLGKSLGIDLRTRKWYTLFHNISDMDRIYPFPNTGTNGLEFSFLNEKISQK